MILITGASGSTGSYLLETLLAESELPVIAWVRHRERLRQPPHPRLQVWDGGLEALDVYTRELRHVTHLIHVATCWGGPDTFKINLRQSWQLLKRLDPEVCRHIHLFSTASLLGAQQVFAPQALKWGTDYIRSKAALHSRLATHPLQIPVSVYYPTVVLGGDSQHPYTAAAAGLNDLPRWLNILRWLSADGRFHLIHARDIARILSYRLRHDLAPARIVLGNPALDINELISRLLKLYQLSPAPAQLSLSRVLPPLTAALRPWMSDWDRYSLRMRHLRYDTVNAASYGLPEDLISPEAMLRALSE